MFFTNFFSKTPTITTDKLAELLAKKTPITVLDVRTPPEFHAIPESGDVVVSFDKINELMAEKRQNARAEVEKAETPKTPEAACSFV